jgi:pilus assembly protein CpaB
VSRTATLELTPIDAQKIALGQQLGQLSLVLRKPGEEQNIPNVQTVSLDDLRYSYYGSQRPPEAKAGGRPSAMASPPPAVRRQIARVTRPRAPVRPAVVVPSTSTVVVTRGTQASTYEVGGL